MESTNKMESTNNDLVSSSQEQTIKQIITNIQMSLHYKKQYNLNIFCNDFQKISNAIIESINHTDKNISFFMCQSPVTTFPIDFLLKNGGNLECLENYLKECWNMGISMFNYGLEWYLFNNKTNEFDKVSASDTKENNAVLLLRDANTLDLISQHNFLQSEKLLVIFQSRNDIEILRKNFDIGTANHFAHFEME